MVCLAPRAPAESVRPRRLAGASARPLNFTVRGPFVTPHQTVAVALRLFAVWIGLQALMTLPAFFQPNGSDAPGYVYALFLFALTGVLVLVLWFFPGAITAKLLSPQDAQPQSSAPPDTWLAMGCSLLGLWIFTNRVPRLVFDLFILKSMENYQEHSQILRGIIYELIEVAIALWLVLGAKGFRKIFWWAQNAGVRKDL